MLSNEQLELLDYLIGEQGVYSEIIRKEKKFNLNTKLVYLKKAISQNYATFNKALDKLYDANLTGKQKLANLEFIKALKVMNDLCFNQEINYGQKRTKAALIYYFGSVNDTAVQEFQAAVQEMITQLIVNLAQHQKNKVIEQKQIRQLMNNNKTRQTGWRILLNLPSAQLQPHTPQPFHLTSIWSVRTNWMILLNRVLPRVEYLESTSEINAIQP